MPIENGAGSKCKIVVDGQRVACYIDPATKKEKPVLRLNMKVKQHALIGETSKLTIHSIGEDGSVNVEFRSEGTARRLRIPINEKVNLLPEVDIVVLSTFSGDVFDEITIEFLAPRHIKIIRPWGRPEKRVKGVT